MGYEYLGGDLIGSNGQPVKYENTATPQECCQVGGGMGLGTGRDSASCGGAEPRVLWIQA